MKLNLSISVMETESAHKSFANDICAALAESARVRGTGIATRSVDYIRQKIEDGKAVIALDGENKLAGFCYIESWGAERNFVANSGLIVLPEYRAMGLGKRIKETAFQLSRKKFPFAKLFGITTSPAVMKINSALGYQAVALGQLTDDDAFWSGCKSCANYDILERTGRKHCLCTAMLFEPEKGQQLVIKSEESENILAS